MLYSKHNSEVLVLFTRGEHYKKAIEMLRNSPDTSEDVIKEIDEFDWEMS